VGLLELIQSSPALAEFIRQPVGRPLDDERRSRLVQNRVQLLLPYVSQSDIHEAIRADFTEALSLTEELPKLLAHLLSIMKSLEEDQLEPPDAMLLAGHIVERQYEKSGLLNLWEPMGLEVLGMLAEAARSAEDWNAGDVIAERYPDRSDTKNATRLVMATSIMIHYHNILNTQTVRLHASKLATIYDALFYGGILNGIGRRHSRTVIVDRLKETAVTVAVDQVPGLGLLRELAELLTDLFNLENIFTRQSADLASISRYLKSYLQSLRIVGTLAVTLSHVNESLLDSYIRMLGEDPKNIGTA
jgi:hypothetical protein